MNFMKMISHSLVIFLFVVGCGKSVLENQSTTDEIESSAIQSQPVMAEADPGPQPKGQLPEPEGEDALLNRSILFGFDSETLTPKAQSILQHKAKWLNDNPQAGNLIIEGHCDTRGTDAYNMALGEKRAETVKNYLVDLGVNMRRLEIQSYGEEKPAVEGDDEEAWALNRRASFVMRPPSDPTSN